jgi:hypothetical protein
MPGYIYIKQNYLFTCGQESFRMLRVPDHESRDRDVVLVRRKIHLGKPRGVGNLEWGGNGERLRKGRSVYEQPGAKVDGIAPCKRRDSK